MICRFCGCEMPEDGVFCINCGSKVEYGQAARRTSGLKMSGNLNADYAGGKAPYNAFGAAQSGGFRNGPELPYTRENLQPVRQVQSQPEKYPLQKKKNNKGLIIAAAVASALAIAAVIALIFYFVSDSRQTAKIERPNRTTLTSQPEDTLSISDVSEIIEDWSFFYMEGNSPMVSIFDLSADGSTRMYNVCLYGEGGYDYKGTWKPISKDGQTYVVEFSIIGGVALSLSPDEQIIFEQNEYTFRVTLEKVADGLYVEQTECDIPPILAGNTYQIFSPEAEEAYINSLD